MSSHEAGIKVENIGTGIWTFRYEDKIYHFQEKEQMEYFRKGFKTAMYALMTSPMED